MTTDRAPTYSATLDPAISRLNTSRPISSVPSRWAAPGPAKAWVESTARGLSGVQNSEMNATTTTTPTIVPPMSRDGMWVQVG
jgi:hypothetical protein